MVTSGLCRLLGELLPLTGSPFILHDMGYSPAAIGLSYVPQTIAFLLGGYGCRAALQKWEGQQMLPAAGAVCLERGRHRAVGFIPGVGLAEILIPFCVMAVANGAIYPIVVAQALRPFRRRQDAPRRCKIPCNSACASRQARWCQR